MKQCEVCRAIAAVAIDDGGGERYFCGPHGEDFEARMVGDAIEAFMEDAKKRARLHNEAADNDGE